MKKPQKAPIHSITDNELRLLPYPVFGSVKIDGFRCLIDGTPKTSSMKPQPNPFVQSELSKPELNGLDGELVVGEPNSPEAFNASTGRCVGNSGSRILPFTSLMIFAFQQAHTMSAGYRPKIGNMSLRE